MPSVITKLVLKGRLAGTVETRNIFYGQLDLVAPDTREDVCTPYMGNIITPVRSYISSLWSIESYDVYDWVAGDWAFITNIPWLFGGSSSSDMLPNQVAAVLIGKTLAKRKIGRKFLAGFAENASVGSSITGAVLTALASAALAYISVFTTPAGSVFGPGIVTSGGAFYSFNSGVVSSLWGTMRRRKPGLGI